MIVDDEVTTCEDLTGRARECGHTVLGHVTTATQALLGLQRLDLDVVLLDIDLGSGPNGLDIARRAVRRGVTVVFVSGADDMQTIADTHDLGDFLRKPVTTPAVRSLLVRVRARREQLRQRRLSLGDLTEAQLRVCRVLASGESVKGTAAYLGLAEQTVRNHLKAVFARLGIAGQDELRAGVADDARCMMPAVLVLEDERLIADDQAKTLREAGFEVHVAHDVEGAQAVLEAHVIDAATLDLRVGGGVPQLVDQLRQLAIPGLVVSAAPHRPAFAADLPFLRKPVPPRLYLDEVDQLLRRPAQVER